MALGRIHSKVTSYLINVFRLHELNRLLISEYSYKSSTRLLEIYKYLSSITCQVTSKDKQFVTLFVVVSNNMCHCKFGSCFERSMAQCENNIDKEKQERIVGEIRY